MPNGNGIFVLSQKKGGNGMLSETIQEVKNAEAEADARIVDARNQAASIVRQAGVDADKIRKDAEKEAAADYDKTMEKAKKAGEDRLKEAAAEAVQQRSRLRQKTAEQEQAAIQTVIRLVLGG